MHLIYLLSLLLLLAPTIEAYHFRGGTITWKPVNNNITAGSTVSIIITQTYSWTSSIIGCNDSMIATQSPSINIGTKAGAGVNLTCSASCSTSGGYVGNEVPITGYCTDFSNALDLTVSQRSDIVNLTSGAYFIATFATTGGWQTLALGNSTGWSLSSSIDIRARSDNGLINTPPVATCISYLSIPVNVQQTIQIPILDADNDYLKCRFANGSSECANACPPGSLPTGTTLSTSCILTITGTTAGDYYLVAIQVEDFITNTSTTPLSSVSLQFLIYVYAATTCALKPLLLADVSSGVCQGAQVGVNFTMTFTVVNQCGSERTITDIATLSFPTIIKSALVQNATNTSVWSMRITWIPTANQVGSQVFCAVGSDNGRKRRRRRQKRCNESENCFEWSPASGRVHQQLLSGKKQQENHELRQDSSIKIINYSQTSSDATVSRINRKDNTLIDNKDNVRCKQPSGKSLDSSHYLNSSANIQEIDRQDKITKTPTQIHTPTNNFVRIQSIFQDSSDTINFPSSASTLAQKNHFPFKKFPRLTKSSIEPRQSTSPIDSTTQLNEIHHNDFNNLEESKRNVQPLSNVSVRRVKRSSSANPSIRMIPRRTIFSSYANLNRVTVINFK
ncbi:unnamed protein product [Rotaria sp. Silwood1]|nr:unnamed protein product [Rotaria sp. Silwood1]CAF1263216.1 unnamed protein product [Rotaria sp. Silwood1]